ncbi:hypothetical protein HBI56_086150 [Parastagonospora nodorum]|nr:hypothetical protein HBH53_069080 [Parastagonospora nodorum]KAH3979154.1 hypothetical protein HBH52_097120 [Parastagonospora nodorum]KAH3999705.1 hypothetical protein HBI10_116270 [Parastagonospora nodorum]KAH4013298.1 hypothetical protein HBI13_182320 [Parastagonospora nodorum]KAH4035372.1 hypothetical protein HBI09_098840 [Parastagonospora nodorum]
MAPSTPPRQCDSPYPLSSPSRSPQQPFPSLLYTPKILHVADISYPESYLRTPLPLLPFQQSEWLSKPVDKVPTSPGLGTYELDESLGEILESIEGRDEVDIQEERGVWGDGKREWDEWEEGSLKEWSCMGEQASRKRGFEDEEGSVRVKKKCKA